MAKHKHIRPSYKKARKPAPAEAPQTAVVPAEVPASAGAPQAAAAPPTTAGFRNRWLIVGTLKNTSDLHVGSGDVTERDRLRNAQKNAVDVAAVVRHHDGRPMVTGSSLKNVVRRWLGVRPNAAEVAARLLGEEPDTRAATADNSADGGRAGALHFFDAPAQRNGPSPDMPDFERGTWVSAGIGLSRTTRTVVEALLFHEERVPAGTAFGVEIAGQNLQPDEVAWLLAALGEGLRAGGLRLGAGSSDGDGSLEWQVTAVHRLDGGGVSDWLALNKAGYDALPSLADPDAERLQERARELAATPAPASQVKIQLSLNFEGRRLIVNDPSRAKQRGEERNDRFSLDYLRDEQGRVLVRGLRHALRAQAERILRTGRDDAACDITSRDAKCPPVRRADDVERPCLACRLFGGTGWKSAVSASRFTATGPGREQEQDFVAIDRFTGGGADALKFDAQTRVGAVLTGHLEVDLDRLHRSGVLAPALGLLFHVLRDLVEGDVTLGLGRSKGWGRFTVGTKLLTWPASLPGALSAFTAQQLPVAAGAEVPDFARGFVEHVLDHYDQWLLNDTAVTQ
jgi:CRISPR/Cas system CSM-associated protein Csm3 (group 7 of RAMP superfamily)